jgi:hypothetical protein
VPLAEGSLLFEANEPITRVYFVEAGVVSLMAAFHNGGTAEMAAVGWEGMVGVGTLLGSAASLGRYRVQVPGSALAMETRCMSVPVPAPPPQRRQRRPSASSWWR